MVFVFDVCQSTQALNFILSFYGQRLDEHMDCISIGTLLPTAAWISVCHALLVVPQHMKWPPPAEIHSWNSSSTGVRSQGLQIYFVGSFYYTSGPVVLFVKYWSVNSVCSIW